MEKTNEHQCISCSKSVSQQVQSKSNKVLGGIGVALCAACLSKFKKIEPTYEIAAEKLMYLLKQQGYEVDMYTLPKMHIGGLQVYNDNNDEIVIYVYGITSNHAGHEIYWETELMYRCFLDNKFLIRVPDYILDVYPDPITTRLFSQLTVVFDEIERRADRKSSANQLKDNKARTFELKAYLDQFEKLKMSNHKITEQLDESIRSIHEHIKALTS